MYIYQLMAFLNISENQFLLESFYQFNDRFQHFASIILGIPEIGGGGKGR